MPLRKEPAFLCAIAFISPGLPLCEERFCLPQSLNPTPPRAYASVHHTFSILFLFFLFLGFWWHFQSARSSPWDIVHVPTPLRPRSYTHTHTHTHTQGAETHTPRLEPSPYVLVYLREAGAWHREEALVDSVLRLPMLLFWSAASWWQIYIKLIVFSPSLCFSSPPPWHRGKMLL